MSKEEVIAGARSLINQSRHGVLSTISVKLEGFPFGSVVPFCLDENGWPIIFISVIAEHTKNITANLKVSLIVLGGNRENVQANERITIVGNAEIVPAEEHKERYHRYFPQSISYDSTHDFSFYRIRPAAIRYIAGFGAIHWVNPESFGLKNPFYGKQETQIINHMNEDHRKDLFLYCTYYKNMNISDDDSIAMCGIDAGGFDVLLNEQKIRFDFKSKISSTVDAREALVEMSKSASAS
jgi:heme iron utilization protein